MKTKCVGMSMVYWLGRDNILWKIKQWFCVIFLFGVCYLVLCVAKKIVD